MISRANRGPLIVMGASGLVALVTGVMLLSALGSDNTGAEPAAVGSGATRPAGYVSPETLGGEWPLTVPDGVLSCEVPGRVYFTSGGVRYTLNGLATGRGNGVDIRTIRRDDPAVEGLMVDVGPLIDRGLALCK